MLRKEGLGSHWQPHPEYLGEGGSKQDIKTASILVNHLHKPMYLLVTLILLHLGTTFPVVIILGESYKRGVSGCTIVFIMIIDPRAVICFLQLY